MNPLTDKSINIVALVDGGCNASDLVLTDVDAKELGLNFLSRSEVREADGSFIKVDFYSLVRLIITYPSGDKGIVTLDPVVLPYSTTDEVGGHRGRIIGYNALSRLGVKQDFVKHQLIRVIRRF